MTGRTELGNAAAAGIEPPALICGLLGGLAPLLFGMDPMSGALRHTPWSRAFRAT